MADEAGPWGRRERLAALTISLAVTASVFDGVMLNAALPTIAARLGADPSVAIWVVNAYQLAVVLVLLPLGRAADIYGHSRIYLCCIALFGIASLGCALATDLGSLALWRFVQGCGGAGMMGITNAMLRLVHPPERLARGMARVSLIVAMALAAGPTVASFLVSLADWRWLFLVNLPTVAILLVLGLRALPAGTRSGHRYDLFGALLSMATFGAFLLALDTGAHGAAAALPFLLGTIGLLAGAMLLHRQRGQESPLLPVDLLRRRLFGFSVATILAASAAQLTAYVVLPFQFQHGLGRSQIETGLLFLPWPIGLAIAAPVTGWIGDRTEAGRLCAAGLAIFAVGLVLLALLPAGATTADIVWRMAVCGLGYGLYQPPSSRTLLTSAPDDRLGSASVMGATARVMGQALGATVAALLFRILPANGGIVALLVAAGFATAGITLSLSRGAQPLAARSTG